VPRRLAFLLLLGAACAGGAARGQAYGFRTYGAEAGLAAARGVAFDGEGALWVGTNDGLGRFDGERVRPVEVPGLRPGRVFKLTPAPGGAVWGLAEGGQILRVDPVRGAAVVPAPRALVAPLAEADWIVQPATDGRGRLWLSAYDSLLYRWEGRRWSVRVVPGADAIASFFVVGDGDTGRLVVATRQRVGVVTLRGGRPAGPVRWVFRSERVRFVRPHPDALAWVGTNDGVFLIGADGRARLVADGEVWRYGEPAVDAAGRLLVSVQRDLLMHTLRLDPDGRVALDAGVAEGWDNVLPAQYAFDPEGGFWVAAPEGLLRLESEAVRLYPLRAPGGPPELAHSLLGDPARGVLWVGTWGGVYRLDGRRLVRASGPTRRAVTVLVPTPDGAEWGEHEGGRWTWARGRLHNDRRPNLILDDAAGRLETDGVACFRVHGGRRAAVGPACGAAVRRGDAVWLLRDGGDGRGSVLDGLRGDSLATRCRACAPPGLRAALNGLNRDDWYGFAVDRYGRVWVHGSKGLGVAWACTDGVWRTRRFGAADGLLSREVGTIAFSPDGGRMWVGGVRGIQGFRVEAGSPRLAPFAELRAQDGLPGESVSGLLEDGDGRLWAALGPGLVARLDWRALAARVPSPDVRVEGLEAAGRGVVAGEGGLRLRAGDPLVVRLAARTYRRPARVRLEYRLAGLDAAWTDLGAGRTVALAALPAGRYALEVRAVRPGQAPGRAVRLGLRVVPPVWRRPWFAGLVLALVGGAVLAVYRVREGRRRATEALRARIAGDLHDEVGTGLTEVSLYSELIRRAAAPVGGDGGGEIAAWAARVGERARDLSGSVRDLAWAIRPDEDAWEALELRLKDAAVALLDPLGVEVVLHGEVEGVPPPLPLDVRRNALLFAKEALHNAARHAAARRVEVAWHLTRRTLRLTIADDGRGFDAAAVREGTGLGSLRRRAAEMGGTLGLETAPGAGTRLTLDVPLARRRIGG